MNSVDPIIHTICEVCTPLRVIQFAEKRTLSTNKLKSLGLCIIIADGESHALRRKLHLALSVDVPVTLSVYTIDEWEMLQENDSSYAAWISRKGQVLYEQKA